MKRIGNVFEQACDFAALEQAAYRAFRANRGNGDALQFVYNLEPELFLARYEIAFRNALALEIVFRHTAATSPHLDAVLRGTRNTISRTSAFHNSIVERA